MASTPPQNRLATLRTRYDYSLEYVARMLDVSEKQVRLWESGADTPTDEELLLLSKLFDTDPRLLLIPEGEAASTEATSQKRTVEEPAEAILNHAHPHATAASPSTSPFSEYLDAGEQILWEGRPSLKHNTKTRANPKSGAHTVLITVFACIAFVLAFFAQGDLGDRFELIFLVVLLLTMSLWHFLFYVRAMQVRKRKTYYAITDRRILFLCNTAGARARFFLHLSDAFRLVVYENKNGYGTIAFSGAAVGGKWREEAIVKHSKMRGKYDHAPRIDMEDYLTHNLVDIPDCHRIQALIHERRAESLLQEPESTEADPLS